MNRPVRFRDSNSCYNTTCIESITRSRSRLNLAEAMLAPEGSLKARGLTLVAKAHRGLGAVSYLVLRRPLKDRWSRSRPDQHLTWSMPVTGEAFVSRLHEAGALQPDARLLEIGPGYGRILKSLLDSEYPFRSYLGVDVSPASIAYLRENYASERVQFSSPECFPLSEPATCMYSSLVLKHIYPSFEGVLRQASESLTPGGLAVFDLIEGGWPFALRYLEPNRMFSTYIRQYRRPEITAILERCGLALESFGDVWHTPKHRRLLVVARKRSV